MTTRSEVGSYGLLQALSPEMARDLGEAFSLERIGRRDVPDAESNSSAGARGALRFAGWVAAFLLVGAVSISVAVAAIYLAQIS